jgi:hypothetical protein
MTMWSQARRGLLQALGAGALASMLALSVPALAEELTDKVRAALQGEPELDAADISIESHGRVVHLSGFAASSTQISRALDIARGVEGVADVRNELRLKTPAP